MVTCNVCGTSDFSEIDGVFYCDGCQSQSQAHATLEDRTIDVLATHDRYLTVKERSAGLKARRRKLEEHRKRRYDLLQHSDLFAKKQGDDTDTSPTKTAGDLSSEVRVPRAWGLGGQRVMVFTMALKHFCAQLTCDYGVPDSLQRHCLVIWIRYLRRTEVAFCQREVVESDNDEDLWIAKKLEEQTSQAASLNTTTDIFNYLSQSQSGQRIQASGTSQQASGSAAGTSAFKRTPSRTDGTSGESTGESEDEQEPLEDEDGNFIYKPRPLSLTKASAMALGLPTVIATLYIGLLLSGVRWMLYSDLLRWFREGRFQIKRELQALLLARRNVSSSRVTREDDHQLRWIQSLCRAQRHLLALCLDARVPAIKHPLTLHPTPVDIIARLLRTLNLPRALIHRVHALIQLVPLREDTTVLDQRDLKGRYPFRQTFHTADRSADAKSMWQHPESRFEDDELYRDTHCGLEQSTWAGPGSISEPMWPVSLETRMAAYLLLTMRLVFGLDDEFEFGEHASAATTNAFNISKWMAQCRLRLASWEGCPPERLFSTRSPANYSAPRQGLFQYRPNRFSSKEANFEGCLPRMQYKEMKSRHFGHQFQADCTQDGRTDMSVESLLMPLRHQTTIHNSVREFGISDGSQQQIALFFADYDDCCLIPHGETDEVDTEQLFDQSNSRERTTRSKSRMTMKPPKSAATKDSLLALFPAAANYKAYRLTLYDERRFTLDDGPLRPTLNRRMCQQLFGNDYRRRIADSYASVSTLVALVIGEDVDLLRIVVELLQSRLLGDEQLNLSENFPTNNPQYNRHDVRLLWRQLVDKYI